MSCQCENNFIPKPGNNKKLRRLSNQSKHYRISGVKRQGDFKKLAPRKLIQKNHIDR